MLRTCSFSIETDPSSASAVGRLGTPVDASRSRVRTPLALLAVLAAAGRDSSAWEYCGRFPTWACCALSPPDTAAPPRSKGPRAPVGLTVLAAQAGPWRRSLLRSPAAMLLLADIVGDSGAYRSNDARISRLSWAASVRQEAPCTMVGWLCCQGGVNGSVPAMVGCYGRGVILHCASRRGLPSLRRAVRRRPAPRAAAPKPLEISEIDPRNTCRSIIRRSRVFETSKV